MPPSRIEQSTTRLGVAFLGAHMEASREKLTIPAPLPPSAPSGAGAEPFNGHGPGDAQDPFASTCNIGDLICRDLQPEGQHILPSFISTNDLLRLSECCNELIGYRHYLSGVELINPDDDLEEDVNHGIQEGVGRLLMEQRGRIDFLRLCDLSVLPMLMSLADKGGCEVKTLEVSEIGCSDSDHDHLLGTILVGGSLWGVEELHCMAAHKVVMNALAQGAYPCLTTLTLEPSLYQSRQCLEQYRALAAAMTSGYCQRLQDLTLIGNGLLTGVSQRSPRL